MTRRIKYIFTVSVLLNLVLLGVVVGHWSHHVPWNHDVGWAAEREALSPETKKVMREIFNERKEGIHRIFSQARHHKEAMRQAFTAEPFDADAYDRAAQEVKDISAEMSSHKLETFKRVAQRLPLAERKKLANKMERTILSIRGRKERIERHN